MTVIRPPGPTEPINIPTAVPDYPPDTCACGAQYTTSGGYPDPVLYDAFWDHHINHEEP